MLVRLVGAAIVVLVCTVGCKKAAEEAMESAIESQIAKDGGSADVDFGKDDMTIKYEDKKSGSKMAFGKNTELPKDFPQDVPVYQPMTLIMAQSQKEKNTFILSATSADAVSKIAAFYTEETKKQGWSEVSNMDQGEKMHAVNYKKEGRVLNVVMATTDEGTSIMINTGQE